MYSFSFLDFKIINLAFSVTKTEPQTDVECETKIEIGQEKEGKRLSLFLRLSVESESMPFSILVEGAGLFEFSQDIEAVNIDSIAEVNCAAIVFPYIRETIADVTRRAGFAPLHLPPINFVRIFEEKRESSEKPV